MLKIENIINNENRFNMNEKIIKNNIINSIIKEIEINNNLKIENDKIEIDKRFNEIIFNEKFINENINFFINFNEFKKVLNLFENNVLNLNNLLENDLLFYVLNLLNVNDLKILFNQIDYL